MNVFNIGSTEFGIGDIDFSIENDLINLEICGNDDVFDKLTENDDSKWSWALYPPKIYFWGVPAEEKTIIVNEELLAQSDIALYIMEHSGFTGTLEITDNVICIPGQVNIMGEELPVSINVEVNNL